MMFLKLVGRYKLNAAIVYDGSIRHINLSFKDYLYKGILASSDGLLSLYQDQFFDEKYFKLKQELLARRYQDYGNQKDTNMVRCICLCGRSVADWDGTYNYYDLTPLCRADSKFTIDEQQIISLNYIKNTQLDSVTDFINSVKLRYMLSEDLQKYIHISCREESISIRNIAESILPVMVETLEADNKKS